MKGKNIAEVLRRIRHLRGISQDQAAAMAGVTRATYAAYEEGRAQPKMVTISELCDNLGFETIDDFLSVMDKQPKNFETALTRAYASANDTQKSIIDFILKLK